MITLINWKVFFILWIASILATIAVLPYSLALQSSALSTAEFSMSLPTLLALQVVQNGILFGVMIFLGLLLAGRVGLGTPILNAATRGEHVADRVRAILPLSIVLGVIVGLLIIGLDVLVFQAALLQELGDTAALANLQNAKPAAWQGFLASFYGGIAEEIQLRLFLMSLLVWVGRFISKTSEGKPTNAVMWIAIILAAALFGLGHLPATAMVIPLTPLVVARAIVLNGLGGVIFGWLYWKRGLEAAMISHFSTDIILHVLFAL